MVNCWSRSAIPAWGCPRKRPSRSLTRSLPPSPKAPGWDYLSAAPLSSRTKAVCGPRRTTDGVQRSISLCRPQPKPCKRPPTERDSVSLGLPRGDTDRDQGKPTAKKVVALHHAPIRKVCAIVSPDQVPSIYEIGCS